MSRVAASLTVFCVFLIRVASSVDPIPSAKLCLRCQIIAVPSGNLDRDERKEKFSDIDVPEDKKELYRYCLKECSYLFNEQSEESPTKRNKELEPGSRTVTELRQSTIPGVYAVQTIKYYVVKMMVIFGGVLDCAINNTAAVLEATLELPHGTFGMDKCEQLDVVALGVPPFYMKLIQTIAKILIPRARNEMPRHHVPEYPFPISPDHGFHESAKNDRRQKRAPQWKMEKN